MAKNINEDLMANLEKHYLNVAPHNGRPIRLSAISRGNENPKNWYYNYKYLDEQGGYVTFLKNDFMEIIKTFEK